ncbi:MAG: restriction endonuclease [Alphaproteobacteria bacterium]|nr:restriction endonuclease [Alphaproteobacteria bacterium]
MNPLEKLNGLYDIINYRNAAGILQTGCPDDFNELIEAFVNVRLSVEDLTVSGGNESNIPKKFSVLLRSKGWRETQISGDLLVKLKAQKTDSRGFEEKDILIEKFLDGHKIDYVKNRIAFDLEWNSKDQTFDRDLYAFAAFYQANIIDAAVLVTRSASMNQVFEKLNIKRKYGASTTWMGKLDYRINANRSGGCPVLALGITPKLIQDWPQS